MQYEYEECSSDLGESDSSNSSDRSEGRDISSKSRGLEKRELSKHSTFFITFKFLIDLFLRDAI